MQSKTLAAIAALMLLGACAQTETKQTKPPENTPAVQAVAQQEPAKATAPAPAAAAVADHKSSSGASAPFTDHTVIEFEAKSRTLGDDARESVALLGGSAQHARQIVITGYCDKRAAGNAKEVALFRAMAVKNELVNLGASEKIIRVKYVTSQPKHEVTIDLTEK